MKIQDIMSQVIQHPQKSKEYSTHPVQANLSTWRRNKRILFSDNKNWFSQLLVRGIVRSVVGHIIYVLFSIYWTIYSFPFIVKSTSKTNLKNNPFHILTRENGQSAEQRTKQKEEKKTSFHYQNNPFVNKVHCYRIHIVWS